jgi:hypothetical protein
VGRRSWPGAGSRQPAALYHGRSSGAASPEGDEEGAELALADTSVFIAVEQNRPLAGRPPGRVAVSVITVGELRLGLLAADSGNPQPDWPAAIARSRRGR